MVYFLCKAYDSDRQNCYFAQSLPVRGAWIEIVDEACLSDEEERRSPCGERGLKCIEPVHHAPHYGRSPCGERGLKCREAIELVEKLMSLPVRGAWIEI